MLDLYWLGFAEHYVANSSSVCFSITKNSLFSSYFERGDGLHFPNNTDKKERENRSDRRGCSRELLDKIVKER